MKAFLMYRDRDFDLERKLPSHHQALTQDLELETLLGAMAGGDKFLFELGKKAVLSSLEDLDSISYRQDVLRDCLKNPSIVRRIYDVAVESIESERKHSWGLFSKYPGLILRGSTDVLHIFVGTLKKLRDIADEDADKFESEGFTALLATLRQELTDEFFASIQNHLKRLKFRNGVLVSADLGKGNKGADYILRKPHDENQSWLKRLVAEMNRIVAEKIFAERPAAYSFHLHPRDEAGGRVLSELRDRGINLVANALAQSTDHILSFLAMLRAELAFYIGCLNLHGQLANKGEPTCFPQPAAPGERKHSFNGLYDVCLALTVKHRVVGNDVAADGKDLVIITGANQGGKSTFLRGIGLAQLMMQCGMFVPAESFCSNLCKGLFTHYKREEDASMKSGKLDEELSRMSAIVDDLTPNAMVLFNESFAATNEREGSEIARQIVRALLEKRVKMFFVTHFYDLANSFWVKAMGNAIFLRAERQPDGARTFKLIVGEPLQTSYGEDLYKRIFGIEAAD
jgi:DNA mismatch repair ATPase MutS